MINFFKNKSVEFLTLFSLTIVFSLFCAIVFLANYLPFYITLGLIVVWAILMTVLSPQDIPPG